MQAVKLTINGCSGYGTVDEAYEDKLVLTASSITYEYKPHPMSNSSTNVGRKWTFKTDNCHFQIRFETITSLVEEMLGCSEETSFACDMGAIEVILSYDNKHKEKRVLYDIDYNWRQVFASIAELIPNTEDSPNVLQQNQ